MAIGWKGETRGRRVDKGVKGLLSHSRHSKRTWCGLQFFMEEARVSAQGGTSNPLETILAAITSSQRETRELRAELRAAQEEAAERAARKSEKPYHFQKKAHEDQAFFNENVTDHILEAESQLSRAARLVADGPACGVLGRRASCYTMDH